VSERREKLQERMVEQSDGKVHSTDYREAPKQAKGLY